MTDKFLVKNYNELQEGEPVLLFAVHVLRWKNAWGDPAYAIISVEDTTANDYAALVSAAQEAERVLRQAKDNYAGIRDIIDAADKLAALLPAQEQER